MKLTEEERRGILAGVMEVMVELLFSTHLYSFGGNTYLQKDGGPIGLRGTCAVARVLMCEWDMAWLRRGTGYQEEGQPGE